MQWFMVASSFESQIPAEARDAIARPFVDKFPGVVVDEQIAALQAYMEENHPDANWTIERNIIGNTRLTILYGDPSTKQWMPE